MVGDERLLKSLQGCIERREAVLREVLVALEADGKYPRLVQKIKKVLPNTLADDEEP